MTPVRQLEAEVGVPERVALGMALGARAADSAEAALKGLREHMTDRTHVERKVDTLTIATLVIARWLITGEGATHAEMDWLAGVGADAVADGTPLAMTAKGAMAWRDFLLQVLEKEGKRLGSSREVLAEARLTVRMSSDANLIASSRAYDQNMTELNAAFGHQALHDDLTGLPNRRLFHDRLGNQLLAAQRTSRPVGVLLMDLDRFKDVNDTLGHEAGDQLLTSFAVRMNEVLRSSDTVARLGGDEFGILPAEVESLDGLIVAAKKILDAVDKPFEILDTTIQVEASIGIAYSPDHGSDVGTLMRRADIAMYVAKKAKSRYAVYATEHEGQINKRIRLFSELRHGIAGGELFLEYQPKIDLASGRTIGVEALVRWVHPTSGLIVPEELIPLAEESGLIGPLTTWVLNDALRQIHVWQEMGIDLIGSVNLSGTNLLEPDLAEVLAGLLRTWKIGPGKLILELTESTLISSASDQMLRHLRRLRVGLSIDDYGTGYSSLVRLRRLPLTELKLDQTFVGGITAVRKDKEIVRATINLGHRLDLSISAEGVTDEATLCMLAELGCDSAQGYYIAAPMLPSEVPGWLRESRWPLSPPQRRKTATG
ncbi:MAG TPA: EAL domain-containing protein [Candidatus Dormibacteraeota bacterium]|nr:EAL domain-containing protein [Candidatus Dormibacteraeota bacterium]